MVACRAERTFIRLLHTHIRERLLRPWLLLLLLNPKRRRDRRCWSSFPSFLLRVPSSPAVLNCCCCFHRPQPAVGVGGVAGFLPDRRNASQIAVQINFRDVIVVSWAVVRLSRSSSSSNISSFLWSCNFRVLFQSFSRFGARGKDRPTPKFKPKATLNPQGFNWKGEVITITIKVSLSLKCCNWQIQ